MFQRGVIQLLLLLLFTIGCKPSSEKYEAYDDYEPGAKPTKSKIYTVEIKQMKFIPDRIVVREGDKIVWINKDFVDHDITEEHGKAWSSPKLPPNTSWVMTVTKNETYYCSIHVVMKGRVVIEGEKESNINQTPIDFETANITMCR